MSRFLPYPNYIFLPETRHAVTVAHQDDELGYSGLFQRLGEDSRFLWLTNGDGLAPFVNEDPQSYAEKRLAECRNAMTAMGRKTEEMTELAHSEIAIYDRFVELGQAGADDALTDIFEEMAEQVLDFLRKTQPDVVWTLMFQGGHPEHDLIHLITAYALKRYEKEIGREILFMQLPEYELTILIAMRFPPWYRGARHEIILTAEEMERKRKVIESYPSQQELFEKFQKVLNATCKVTSVFGSGDLDVERFLARETFGPVPSTLDYMRSPHHFPLADYLFEKHNGTKIHYEPMLSAIARRLERWSRTD